ncbi:MAG: TIGR00725 family protein [Acidimicrobiales bacterium]
MKPGERAYVAVIGAGDQATPERRQQAEDVGRELARHGAVVVCGGLAGVMEAACRGAKAEGGTTLAILPGTDRRAANPFVDVAVATGLGELRNGLVVRSADAVVAVGGEFGTLSEIAQALKAGKPVVGVGTWDIPGVVPVDDPAAAARSALDLSRLSRDRPHSR